MGNEFDDKALIKWSKERQAMKVLNLNDKKRYLMVARAEDKKELTAYEILTRNKHLSTHDGADINLSDIDKLESSIANAYDLMDSIKIYTELPVNQKRYFVATYRYGDTKLTKRLNHEDKYIVIDKSIFYVDEEHLDPRDITLSIDYIRDENMQPIFIKDGIKVTIVPETLD